VRTHVEISDIAKYGKVYLNNKTFPVIIVQFTVLYIGVVESRQRTRVTVSCSAFVGIK